MSDGQVWPSDIENMAAQHRMVILAVAPLLATVSAWGEAAPGSTAPILDLTTGPPVCGPAEPMFVSPAWTPRSVCPADMVAVVGEYCPALEQVCDKYISEPRDRCDRFRRRIRCFGQPRPHRFCIDRYEYPNQAGVHPQVGMTWDQAQETCAAEGKRLCTGEEWTLACEGPEGLPYPYGFVRDARACNIDRTYIMPNLAAYDDPETRPAEIARLSQSEPSGWRERCVSAYGVYDMTGNVDEWVVNQEGSFNGPEYDSGLKGGYWGPVRNRCRPMTTDHNHWHTGYQVGFRCCAETDGGEAAPECVASFQTLSSADTAPVAAVARPTARESTESVPRRPPTPVREAPATETVSSRATPAEPLPPDVPSENGEPEEELDPDNPY